MDMLTVFGLSALVTAVCLLFPTGTALCLGADGASVQGLRAYIPVTAAGILPQMLCAQLSAFLQLEQQNKRVYVGIVLMMAVNALLDYLFIVVLRWELLGLNVLSIEL